MRYIKNTILLILSIWLFGCEVDVDSSDLLDQEQLTIINGFISPQDVTLKVQVSKSKVRGEKVTSDEDYVIKGAIVTILDEAKNEIRLNYNQESLNYEAPVTSQFVKPGKKYYLSVIVTGKEFKSSCVIPLEKVEKIQQKISDNTNFEFNGNKKLRVTVNDIENKDNFYIIGAKFLYSHKQKTALGKEEITEDSGAVRFSSNQFVTDVKGSKSVVIADGYFYGLYNYDNVTESKFKIQVSNTEKILYDFLRAEFINKDLGEDFFTDPIIAPTNIEGENAYGVFGGFNITEVEIKL